MTTRIIRITECHQCPFARPSSVRFEAVKRIAALEAENAALREDKARLVEAGKVLIRFVVDNGADHDPDCSCDDTCECSHYNRNRAINAACRILDEGGCPGSPLHPGDPSCCQHDPCACLFVDTDNEQVDKAFAQLDVARKGGKG